jgi:hypothetical protein
MSGNVSKCKASWLGLLVMTLLAAGCSSPDLAPTPRPVSPEVESNTTPTVPPTATATVSGEPCSSGKLLIGDLPEIDQAWRAGLERAMTKATEWQQDAVLSNLRVVCQIFESEFGWQATFYSQSAQAFFSSDTGEVVPAGVEENKVPRLPVQQLSFELVHDALAGAGYGDEIEISPSSGVDIRLNTAESPFGPPEAPDNVILYHVAIERLGEVRDIFVDGQDGKIFLYSM